MIGFARINCFKILFLVLFLLGYGTGCTSTQSQIQSQSPTEEKPQPPSEIQSQPSSEEKAQTPSEESSQTLKEKNSQNVSESQSEGVTQSKQQPPSEQSVQSPSESLPKSESHIASKGTPQRISESTSQKASESPPQRVTEGTPQKTSEGTPQSPMQELESRVELARKDLRISEATEARIAAGLEELKKSGKASPETLEDYEEYLGRAQEMVAENRKTLQELEALQAKYATRSAGPSAPRDTKKTQARNIPDEKEYDEVRKLDRELDNSLAAFDEMLLIELDEIQNKSAEKMRDLAAEAAAAAQRLEEQGVDVDSSISEASSGGQETTRESEQRERSPEEGDAGLQTETAGTRQEGSKGAAGGQTPVQEKPSRPSGHDDDIVARQIREAAEKETDPVLKEKLWKEYEDYKKGTR